MAKLVHEVERQCVRVAIRYIKITRVQLCMRLPHREEAGWLSTINGGLLYCTVVSVTGKN